MPLRLRLAMATVLARTQSASTYANVSQDIVECSLGASYVAEQAQKRASLIVDFRPCPIGLLSAAGQGWRSVRRAAGA
jgi:hypothetical protein